LHDHNIEAPGTHVRDQTYESVVKKRVLRYRLKAQKTWSMKSQKIGKKHISKNRRHLENQKYVTRKELLHIIL
jgi:hypothetical protein